MYLWIAVRLFYQKLCWKDKQSSASHLGKAPDSQITTNYSIIELSHAIGTNINNWRKKIQFFQFILQ